MSRSGFRSILRRALRHDPPAGRKVTRGDISRRSVLGGIGAGSVALAAPRLTGAASPQSVAVIGGGIAGLVAAERLSRAGRSVVIYEARDRVGGRIASLDLPFAPGFRVDLGGSFINSDHEDMLALVDSLGLELIDLRAASGSGAPADEAYLLEGRWITASEVSDVFAPLAERVAADADALDEDWDTHAAAIDAMSVAEYAAQAFAADAPSWAHALIGLVFRSEYGAEPQDASALELVWMAPRVDGSDVALVGESDEAFAIRGGAEGLAVALADTIAAPIRLSSPVRGIRDLGAEGVVIDLSTGESTAHDAAVVTVPFPVLRHIEMDADVPDEFAAMVAELRLGRNEKLHGAFAQTPWREHFGRFLWSDRGASCLWDREALDPAEGAALTFFHGGDEVTALASDAPQSRLALYFEALEPRMPGLTAAALTGANVTNWSADPWTAGSYTTFAPGQYSRFGEFMWYEDDEGATGPTFGNLVFAGEHLSDSSYGYMNGGAETGRLAASYLLSL